MLNYNKIHSDMNRQNIRLTDLARFGKIKYTSLKDRFTKEKLYATEVEMIATYFGKPISYYFDQEERVPSNYPAYENLNLAEEPKRKGISNEEKSQRKIEDLTKELSVMAQKFDKQNKKYLRLLEKVQDNSKER
ncbi:MAG TPA: hypothetical protein DCR40_13120 [Prolixibacteraceae bacterium]|nr:hypothetical protein [Prolixibacteraceae bacterium]